MKKNQFYITTLLIAVAFIGYSYYNNNRVVKTAPIPVTPLGRMLANAERQEEPQMMTEKIEHTGINRAPTTNNLSTITKAELRAMRDTTPKKTQVTNEFKANPHSPPKSLMTFAKNLGPLMEKAYKNENDAIALVDELERCANDSSVSAAARALCVQDTEKVSEFHPQLKEKAEDLRAGVSSDVKKILDTNDNFTKKNVE